MNNARYDANSFESPALSQSSLFYNDPNWRTNEFASNGVIYCAIYINILFIEQADRKRMTFQTAKQLRNEFVMRILDIYLDKRNVFSSVVIQMARCKKCGLDTIAFHWMKLTLLTIIFFIMDRILQHKLTLIPAWRSNMSSTM